MSFEFKDTVEVLEWLNRPENQFTSDLFVIRWEGYMPKISTTRLADLNNPKNIGFAAVVLQEHRRRKRRPGEEDEQEGVVQDESA